MKKQINVVGAIIVKNGKILCAQRAYDNYKTNAYKIGLEIAKHHSIDNNAAAGTESTLSVKSLLSYAPDIPTYEKLKEQGQRNWKDKIKKVLDESLNYQVTGGLWEKWEYRDPVTDKTYTPETSQPLTWAKYSRLMVDFIMKAAPDQTERRKKRAERKAQAAIDAGKIRRKRGRPRKNPE